MEENQRPLVEFTFSKLDGFSRKVYIGLYNGGSIKGIYKMVNGVIHYCSKDGEPEAPTSYNYVIIKDYKGTDHASN